MDGVGTLLAPRFEPTPFAAHIIDPCWGRDDLLWERVAAILNNPETLSPFSAEPSPQHGLDVGFVC